MFRPKLEEKEKEDNKIQEIIDYDATIEKLRRLNFYNINYKQQALKDIINEFTKNNQLISAKLKSNIHEIMQLKILLENERKENKKRNEVIEAFKSKENENIKKIKKLEKILNLKEIEELKEKFQLKENELINMKKNYELKGKEIEKIMNDKEKEIKILNDKLRAKQNKIEELNRELEKKKIENKDLYKNIQDKNNIIKNLEEELKMKKKKCDNIITHFEEITNQNKKLKEAEEEIKKKEEENKKLRQTNKNLSKNNATDKAYFDEEENKNRYDVVIEIDSINTLTKKGWKINYNENNKEKYEKIIKKETLKIGVLGFNNVGKSFILSLLAGLDIPTGFSIETKGISIKYTENEGNCAESNKGICILDSAGLETPLLNEEISDGNTLDKEENKDEIDKKLLMMQKLQEIAQDKGQTERFIEELIISLSDMLILVVGKLTRREQNLITRIKDIVNQKENNQFKSIIIIHNLAQYNEVIEVEKHINQVLKKSATFKLIERKVIGIEAHKGKVFFTEEDDTDHYIMARASSPAGDEYNQLAIDLIKNKYNSYKSRREIDIPLEILNLFSKMSKDLIEDNLEIKNLKISEDRKTIIMVDENKNENKKSDIKCQKQYIDEMGKYNSISSKFIPKFGLYAYKEQKDKYILLVRLEIPGKIENLTAGFFKYGKKKTIQFKGKKERDEFPEMKIKTFVKIDDNRNYEEIRYLLHLPDEIELSKETPSEKTGIYEFCFSTANIEDSLEKKENDDEDDEDDNDEIVDQNKDKEDVNSIKGEKITIASGVYVFKFSLTETSWSEISKKYKKQKVKYNN